MVSVASPAVPTTQILLFCCKSRSVRERLVTRINGTVSAAPQATLRAIDVNCADLSLGTITATAPAASAVRKHAPKLCGSVTPSKTNKSGFCLFARISSRSFSLSSFAACTRAMTP